MEMNGTSNIIIVLMSLILPIAPFNEFFYKPTIRPPVAPHMRDPLIKNQFSGFMNETQKYDERFVPTEHQESQHAKREDALFYPNEIKCTHGLCENVAGYPKDQIKNLLERSHFVTGYFNITEEIITIENRFNTEEMSLCETTVHTIYPETANNTMKIEKVIVNVDGYKQGVVFETCVNTDPTSCKFSSTFPTGYKSYCKQKYTHKKLMVLGEKDKLVFDSFEIPSCCVCTLVRTN